MKKYWLLLMLGMILSLVQAQREKNAIKAPTANQKQPFILFFSGDGGLNNFSSSLCQALEAKGYPVLAIDSKTYFWKRKTPQQLSTEMTSTLHEAIGRQSNPHFIVMGYSFGADVIPFLVNRLPDAIKNNLLQAIMLEPSTSTDLEIHLADLIGRSHVKRSLDVIAEINKMVHVPTTLLFGSETKDFPITQLHTAHMSVEILAGDHRFDGNKEQVLRAVLKALAAN